MNFSSKDYLPNSGERITRLQEIVAGRPVAILAAGPSIQGLEERIDELRHVDICYFGLNLFFVQETHILGQIGKHASVVLCGSRDGMPEAINSIFNFLNRNEDNMFISSFNNDTFGTLGSSFNLGQFLNKYDRKLIFIHVLEGKSAPNNDYPLHFMTGNSLLSLIQMALIAKASSIVLFGADGHCGENARQMYYRQNEYKHQKWLSEYRFDLSLIHDTMRSFNPVAPIAIRNTCRAYRFPLINILNCSEKSFYTPFPKVSYDEALEFLVTGEKLIGKLDLRVPAKPKMPNIWLSAVKKVLNFWKKHRWNSFRVITVRTWCRLINVPDRTKL